MYMSVQTSGKLKENQSYNILYDKDSPYYPNSQSILGHLGTFPIQEYNCLLHDPNIWSID